MNNLLVFEAIVYVLISKVIINMTTIITYGLVRIPTTLIHEVLHLVVGLLFNAKPSHFTIIPKRKENDSFTFGEVGFNNIRWYSAFPIAFAPILFLYPAYELFLYLQEGHYFFQTETKLISFLILTYVINDSFPSRQDLKVALSYPLGTFLWAIPLYYFFF